MRKKISVVEILLLLPLCTMGCQSTSQKSWWKTAKTPDIESTALARSAPPELPSEVAKQNEKLADTGKSSVPPAAGESTVAGMSVPGTTQANIPASYPSTSYPTTPYQPTTAVASLAKSTMPGSEKKETPSLPYNPSAVPPKSSPESSLASTGGSSETPLTDRYGVPIQPANRPAASGNPVQSSMSPGLQTASSRYGNLQTSPSTGVEAMGSQVASSTPEGATVNTPNPSGSSTVQPTAQPSFVAAQTASQSQPGHSTAQHVASESANRYGLTSQPTGVNQPSPINSGPLESGTVAHTPVPANGSQETTHSNSASPASTALAGGVTAPLASNELANTELANTGQSENPATHTNVVSNGNYRPGGTSNYPTAASYQSPVQVASRPGEASLDVGRSSTGQAAQAKAQQLPPQQMSSQQMSSPQTPSTGNLGSGSRY